MSRTVFTDADIVTPNGLLTGHALVVSALTGRVVALADHAGGGADGDVEIALPGRTIVPGFVDVHVHGLAGIDVLDGEDAVARVAARMPAWGVTAFAPTSIACAPDVLERFLGEVARARATRGETSARVLGAHLESNFINPAFAGAQPLEAIRSPDRVRHDGYSGADVLGVIEQHTSDIGIVTLAPEQPGGLALVRDFSRRGMRVSLGHSGASFDDAMAAFAEGATRATHLFSAMPPFSHRAPGLVGAALVRPGVTIELIADGVHAHPAALGLAMAAASLSRVAAISDGTAASGLPAGSRATLGGRPITASDAARLDNGALAGSVATMDRVFRVLVEQSGLTLTDAVQVCCFNPATDLGLADSGRLAPGAQADLVVLDANLRVEATWIAGRRVWPHPANG